MRISKSTKIKAPAETVWCLIGTEFTEVGNWASSVYHSSAKSGMSRVASAPVAGRTCETSLGPFSEEIVSYSDSDMRIAYSVSGDKMPGFMKSTVADWSIKKNFGRSMLITDDHDCRFYTADRKTTRRNSGHVKRPGMPPSP